jgi:hypothetical protein
MENALLSRVGSKNTVLLLYSDPASLSLSCCVCHILGGGERIEARKRSGVGIDSACCTQGGGRGSLVWVLCGGHVWPLGRVRHTQAAQSRYASGPQHLQSDRLNTSEGSTGETPRN